QPPIGRIAHSTNAPADNATRLIMRLFLNQHPIISPLTSWPPRSPRSMSRHQSTLLTSAAAADEFLQLFSELGHDVFHRPGRAICQATDRCARYDADGAGHLLQDLQVFDTTPPVAHAIHHLHHPACPLAAGRALAARLMREKAAAIVEHLNDGSSFIEDGDRRRAQPKTADFARPVEVERRVELLLGHDAHADTPRNAALGIAPLPDSSAMPVDQLPHGDPHWQLHTTRLVHLPAEAVEFWPIAAGVARVFQVGRHSHRLKPVGTAVDNVSDAGQRFDVIDHRRLAKRAFDGGERRLDAWPGSLAL